MTNTKLQGRWGEELAADYLRKKGYRITAMGYRTRMGEIDIIAENRKYLVFAEVKLRKSDSFAKAMEFVDGNKQRRLTVTALQWLSRNPTGLQPRFDVIEIYAPLGMETAKPIINHIKNAFEMKEGSF
ncbi:MAG: YraN family protein [Oscillospiraceae bacterium]|nr:YraN family protein [Oscillospiraceae bacterium]